MVPNVQNSPDSPREIGVYRLGEEIGSGAMGKVYRATHINLGKEVALKLLHFDDPDGEVRERFLQEGVAASRIRHPNVVEILDAGTDGGIAFLAMQLLEGETLADCLSRQGRLPQTYAVDLLLPVCAALSAAHDAGVLHRDLKPANIFLNDVGRGDPEPMLLDFGISKILGPVNGGLTQNPRFLGTPLYIAPEQADGATGSPASDQYSLALTLYETILGVRPFEKYSKSLIQLLRHVAEGDIVPPRDLDASVPEALDAAICRALRADPEERFASVREFGAALLPFASAPRTSLWEHAFMNAERTMNSANLPISGSRSSRRIQVSVESAPLSGEQYERHTPKEPAEQGDFLSHSELFVGDGAATEEGTALHEGAPSFDPGQSSVSRRHGDRSAPGGRTDTYDHEPSGRTSGTWEEPPSTHPGDRPTWDVQAPLEKSDGNAYDDHQRGAPHVRSTRSTLPWILAICFVTAGLAGIALINLQTPGTQAQDSYAVSIKVTPPDSLLKLDGQHVGTGSFKGTFAKNGRLHRLHVSRAGFESTTVVFQDDTPPGQIRLTPSPQIEGNARQVTQEIEGGQDSPDDAKTLTQEPSPNNKKSVVHANRSGTSSPAGAAARASSVKARKSQTSTAAPAASSNNILVENNSDAPQTQAAKTAPVSPPPSQEEKASKKSIQTGNLDPWAP